MSAKRYLFYISQNYSFAILRPLQALIKERGGSVAWFVARGAVTLSYFSQDERRLMSIDEIMAFKPDAVLYPSNLAPTFLPGINVAIFHGFDAGKLDKRGRNDHYKIRNCFDLYCTQGPSSTKAFSALTPKKSHFKVIETGWCALDDMYKAQKVENAKPTILMCSTFSKRLSCAPHLFETVKRLSKKGKWQWLIQFHPKMDREIVEQYRTLESEYLRFVETDNVVPLLQKADVMVCDTSSVLTMFLLLNKPVVTYNNISPGDYLVDIKEATQLEESIEYALCKPQELMRHIEHFIAETHPYNDGLSSQRVLDAIDTTLEKKHELASKPFDLIRHLKMRTKLKYWKFW